MSLRLLHLWETLRGTLWFVPGAMMLGSVALAVVMVRIDQNLAAPAEEALSLLYAGSADGAREVLGVIASSMVSVAALTFSITTVTLTVASQQYGSRLLRNFMRDTGTQVVLGTFIGTFTYSLLILRRVYGDSSEVSFVPHLSVSLAVALAMVSLGVLIYFIHHIASSIQAGSVANSVATDLNLAIDRLYPEKFGKAPRDPIQPLEEVLPPGFEEGAAPVCSEATGYVQLIDEDSLLELAAKADLLLQMKVRPGHFIVEGSMALLAWPEKHLTAESSRAMQRAVVVGAETTPVQDVEHGVEQLVQISLRALSPAVNDPFTAMVCIDRLGAALSRLAGRESPSPYRADENGTVRVIAWGAGFPRVADAAFRQIRQASRSSPAVKIRLLEAIRNAAQTVHRSEDRDALLHHATLIGEDVELISEDEDRRSVHHALATTLQQVQRSEPDSERAPKRMRK